MKYLLDTTVFIEASRRKGSPKVKAWIGSLVPAQIYLSPVLCAEFLVGVMLLPDPTKRVAELQWLRAAISRFQWADIDTRAQARFAVIRAKTRGVVFGENDVWLAALAMNNGCDLATGDKHFARVPGLKTVNPF